MDKASRRRKVAEAIATLATAADGDEAAPWDDLKEQDRDQALVLADAAINLVDGLLGPLTELLGGRTSA